MISAENSNLFIDLLWGDEAAWTLLFWMSLPFVTVGAGIYWLIEKVRGK